jgi:hypothetical protein
MKVIFWTVFEKYKIIKFHEKSARSVEGQLIHANRRKDRQTNVTKLIVAFRNFAHPPKNQNLYIPLFLEVISVARSLQLSACFLLCFFLTQNGTFRTSEISGQYFPLRDLEVMVSYAILHNVHHKRGPS